MNSQLASVYAKALFDACNENGSESLKVDLETLGFFREMLNKNPKLYSILENPLIEKKEKKEVISKLFLGVENRIPNFLKILIDKQRFDVFEEIYSLFEKKYYEKEKIAKGYIYSPRKMEKLDIEKVEKTLTKKFNKKVELKNLLDEDLIGGFRVQLEGKFIDNSIKGRLEDLKSSLKKKRGELWT